MSHTGGHGLYLFDSIVYSSHLANQSPDEELVKSANEARNTAFDYLKSLGNWSSPESLKLINTKNQDLSGNASACPTNMGEGESGPFHCPLPKVVRRSEEVPQTSNLNHGKTNNIEHHTRLKTGLEDKREALSLHMTQFFHEPNDEIHTESQNLNMKTSIQVPLKPKHKASPPQVLSPQECQTAYKDLRLPSLIL